MEMKTWWDTLMTEGPKYGYYPKPSKSFLIVKQYYKELVERNSQVAKSRSQHNELDTLVQSMVKSVSKKNFFDTKYSHGKIN